MLTCACFYDDYAYFEFTNTTVQMSSLAGGSSNSVGVVVVPSYAGNHTLSVAAIASVSTTIPPTRAKPTVHRRPHLLQLRFHNFVVVRFRMDDVDRYCPLPRAVATLATVNSPPTTTTSSLR